MTQIYTPGKISILCPTRGRPENVLRKIESVFKTATKPNLVEIIFYVDSDDLTFPNSKITNSNVKVVTGPRMWLSILQNVLYTHATGEILMYTGDDVIFESQSWDQIIREEFDSSIDKLILVYGSDGGFYGERIALHGFLHRNWIDAVGCWVQPGRAVPYDFWLTETARQLGKLRYREDLKFTHLHFRQGDKASKFDSTYAAVSSLHSSFRPLKTYKKIARERRIDRVLLSERINSKVILETKYLASEIFLKIFKSKFDIVKTRRIKTLSNLNFVLYLFKNFVLLLWNLTYKLKLKHKK